MEGDFPRLHLNDIEDMLLLVVQNRLFNLEGDIIMHSAVALRMFTRRIVIQKRVEDLQLGVESYQKKLNISRPLTHKAGIIDLEPFAGKKVDEEVGKICWWKRIWERPKTASADNMTLYRCSFPRSSQNRRDLPRDIPLDRIEVHRYDTKGVKARKGIMQTKTKLTLEQPKQGVSDEVSVSIKGVEE
ncbi:hypothetical protein Tco_0269521 [Tanacetum coccineum]